MNLRVYAALTMLLACGSGEPTPTTPASSGSASGSSRHKAHVHVTKCTPVGFGFSCEADLDGDPATLEACVGTEDHVGLTPRIKPPLTLSVDVEAATDADRYCGILILPSGKHVRIVAVE